VRILIVSCSHDRESRSEELARRCLKVLDEFGAEATLVSLKDHTFPPFDDDKIAESIAYRNLYPLVSAADGLVLAGPVYNWGLCGAMKEFIEYIGSTAEESGLRGALFDKVVSFVCAAGLPHSYMAFGPTALSLMLDFKCIVNPYQVYVHGRHWSEETLSEEADERLRRAMSVMLELTTLLKARSYQSKWSV